MTSTGTKKDPEVALILAHAEPADGWNIYWLISKMQIEYILRDIAAVPPRQETPHIQRAQYQEEVLPVLCLEKFYGLNKAADSSQFNYLVVKVPLLSGGITKTILRLSNPIRIRKLNFNATQARQTGLPTNEENILGAFTLPDNQLVIVPDIATILLKEL